MDWPKIKAAAPRVYAAFDKDENGTWKYYFDNCSECGRYDPTLHDFAAFLRAEYGVYAWVAPMKMVNGGIQFQPVCGPYDGKLPSCEWHEPDHDTALFAACLEGAKVAEGMAE